jgi:hypothetical protein
MDMMLSTREGRSFQMTTATTNKTPVQASWNPTKIQQETAEAFARNMGITMSILAKQPEAMKEFEKLSTESKVAYYKQLGVKTPLDLVKAMAEFETNVFGSKIKFWGDDKQASMEYEVCGCWNAMQKVGVANSKNEEELGKGWAACLDRTAKGFGFSKAEVTYGTNPAEACAVITFVR